MARKQKTPKGQTPIGRDNPPAPAGSAPSDFKAPLNPYSPGVYVTPGLAKSIAEMGASIAKTGATVGSLSATFREAFRDESSASITSGGLSIEKRGARFSISSEALKVYESIWTAPSSTWTALPVATSSAEPEPEPEPEPESRGKTVADVEVLLAQLEVEAMTIRANQDPDDDSDLAGRIEWVAQNLRDKLVKLAPAPAEQQSADTPEEAL